MVKRFNKVGIKAHIGQGDLVTTRKVITGTHQSILKGIAPTAKTVSILVIDIVRVRAGQLVAHWGHNTFSEVLAQLAGK